MNDEIILSGWQQIKVPFKNRNTLDTIDEFNKLKNNVRARNRREVFTASVLIIAFVILTAISTNLLCKLGAMIIVMSCIVVVYILRSRDERKLPDLGLPPIAYLNEHLQYLKHQAKLLSTVAYWYVIPPMAGEILFLMGLKFDLGYTLIFLSIILLINVRVLYLNRLALINNLNPKIDSLEHLLNRELKNMEYGTEL